jgi:hypothetical protein
MIRGLSLRAAACAATVALAACGGDSSPSAGGSAPPPSSTGPSPTCSAAGQPFSVAADASVPVGRVAGAVLAGCSGALREVVWTQVSGPAVTLLSARTQAITFEPTVPGTYQFSVSFLDAGGAARTASATVNVTPATTPVGIVVRGDQAVRAGGKASVRAWPAAAAGETITWTQVAGPAVTLDTSDTNRIIFTAPQVAQDTTLVFRATRGGSAAADSDDAMVVVEAFAQAPSDPNSWYAFAGTHVSRVYAYKPAPANPFAAALVRCTFNPQLQYGGAASNACPLATLPLLHTTTGGGVPTVAQIMDRVLVSHDWMGKALEDLLTANASNVDLLRLFNGVTAVVIGAHVRPSYYYAATGAIYLDADNFWRTADERDVIDEAPDFRSQFDRDLQYSGLWRYVEGSTNIFFPWSATSRAPRELSFVLKEAGWLLYHELGHASDFVPPAVRPALDPKRGVWSNIQPRFSRNCTGQLPSDVLCRTFPLRSAEMKALAQVKFDTGPVPDTTLVNGIFYSTVRLWGPAEVAGFFAADIATDEYNYTSFDGSFREDIAMVFEEALMARNHNWRRDVAITDKLGSGATGSSVIVRWGQRGRVGDAAVKPRAQFVVGQLAPWIAAADIAALPPPIPMRAGESWNANLSLPAPPTRAQAQLDALSPRLTTEQEERLLRRALTRQVIGIAGPAQTHLSLNDRLLRRAAAER